MDYSNYTKAMLLEALADPNEINLNPIWNELVRHKYVKETDNPQEVITKYRQMLGNQSTAQAAQQAAEAANARIAEYQQRHTPSQGSIGTTSEALQELSDSVTPTTPEIIDVPTAHPDSIRTSATSVPVTSTPLYTSDWDPTMSQVGDFVISPNADPDTLLTAPSGVSASTGSPMFTSDWNPEFSQVGAGTAARPTVATPVARTVPDSLQLPPTSAASVANSFQLPQVGRDIPVIMSTDSSDSLLKALAETRGDTSGETPAMNAFKKKRGRDSYTSTMRGIANPDPVTSGGRAPLRMGRTLGASSVPKSPFSGIDGIIGEDTPTNGLTGVTSPQTVTFGKGKGRHDLLVHTPEAIGSHDDLRSFFRRFGIGGSKGSGDPLKAAATGSAPKTGGLFAPGFGAKVQEGLGKLSDPQLNWTKGTGLKAYGHNIGGLASTAQGLYGAYQIADALSENTKAKNTTEDITSDILTAAAGNPMAAYDLTADQKRLLGELKRGSYEDSSDMGSLDWGAGLSGALKGGVAGFLGGGTLGAAVGALSSGVPAAMRGMASEQERKNAELEALYAALSESDARYRDARRQKAMRMYY